MKFQIRYVEFDTRSLFNETLDEDKNMQAALSEKWTGHIIDIDCLEEEMEEALFKWFENTTGWLFHKAILAPLFKPHLPFGHAFVEYYNSYVHHHLPHKHGELANGFTRLQVLIVDPLA